jgi:hypothetical protein
MIYTNMYDWEQADWNTFEEHLLNDLRNGEVTLMFTKVDGTARTMRCTLSQSLLPPVDTTREPSTRKKAEHVLAVYDLDKQGWRSVRLQSIWKIAEGAPSVSKHFVG